MGSSLPTPCATGRKTRQDCRTWSPAAPWKNSITFWTSPLRAVAARCTWMSSPAVRFSMSERRRGDLLVERADLRLGVLNRLGGRRLVDLHVGVERASSGSARRPTIFSISKPNALQRGLDDLLLHRVRGGLGEALEQVLGLLHPVQLGGVHAGVLNIRRSRAARRRRRWAPPSSSARWEARDERPG